MFVVLLTKEVFFFKQEEEKKKKTMFKWNICHINEPIGHTLVKRINLPQAIYIWRILVENMVFEINMPLIQEERVCVNNVWAIGKHILTFFFAKNVDDDGTCINRFFLFFFFEKEKDQRRRKTGINVMKKKNEYCLRYSSNDWSTEIIL